jgi:hypothetical protein
MTDTVKPYLRSLSEYEPPVTDDLDDVPDLAGRAWSPEPNVEDWASRTFWPTPLWDPS